MLKMQKGGNMREPWKIFYDSKTGEELGGYTLRGTFEGEEQATRELLAFEKGIPAEQIKAEIERRATK